MTAVRHLRNFIGGEWRESRASDVLPVLNPATARPLAHVPLSAADDVDAAVRSAAAAFPDWSRTPVGERIQPLFRFKALLDAHLPELAETITNECGKTRTEALAELRRAVESVETACAIPSLIQGYNNEDIARGVDEHLFRQPLGVVAAIAPFNFPAMIPMWFLPYAIACGNCFVLKPSERVPMTSVRLVELLEQSGLPKGVVQLVHGGRATVEALIDHPQIQAVSFVGSTPAARAVYTRATALGKRAQCQGGAKNPVVVLPDADMKLTTQIVADSAFGCAGQRCLAASMAITVGEAHKTFSEAICATAAERRVGYGLDENIEMGPVISSDSRARIERLIHAGTGEGASIRVDGRGRTVSNYADGYFLHPTVLDNVSPSGEIARTEIFGPVLSLTPVKTLDDAVALVNRAAYGNMACLFTSSGAAARQFRRDAVAGNIGINVGVAAPMAFFPFSGWKDSFFGDLHAQGRHAVEFYTQTKVVVERWPPEWTRPF